MPSVIAVLEKRERLALVRAEELRAELERVQVAVAAEEAARRAVIAREELVDALTETAVAAVTPRTAVVPAARNAGGVARRLGGGGSAGGLHPDRALPVPQFEQLSQHPRIDVGQDVAHHPCGLGGDGPGQVAQRYLPVPVPTLPAAWEATYSQLKADQATSWMLCSVRSDACRATAR